MLEAWKLAALEDMGLISTNTGLINRVARALIKSPNTIIEAEEFRRTCYSCGIDPDSFSESDFEELQRKINELS